MKRFYFAHPFDSRSTLRSWEKAIESKFNIDLFNPFYDAEDRSDVEAIDTGQADRYENLDPTELVENDLDTLTNTCDGLIGIVDGSRSYGTIMEIAWAHNCDMPVYLIVTNGHEKHPWLMYHSEQVFSSFKDFEAWLQKEFPHV